MEHSVSNLAVSIGALQIVDTTPQQRRTEFDSTNQHGQGLRVAIAQLVQICGTVNAQSQRLFAEGSSASPYHRLSTNVICSLNEDVSKLSTLVASLQATIDEVSLVTERSIIRHIALLGRRKTPRGGVKTCVVASKFLSHFDHQIVGIARKHLKSNNDPSMFWKIAEECYKQAVSPSGCLHAVDYYDHHGPLQNESWRDAEQKWIDFWVRVLGRSPGGPTLFHPPATSAHQSIHLEAPPRFLFRCFDETSAGTNGDICIASMAGRRKKNSRVDLLALDKVKASQILHMHPKNFEFGHEEPDNLVSWTSSLLFAIQNAIYKWGMRDDPPIDIKLCVVDTEKCPQGQFARDSCLIEAYQSVAVPSSKMENFFNFRLDRDDFYNGEYLSQGTLNMEGRSCVCSLHDLIEAGLFQLYPEFLQQKGMNSWAKRVTDLRAVWSSEQLVSAAEIDVALKIARNCFPAMPHSRVAAMLLLFKKRKFTRRCPTYKPVEVSRYYMSSKVLKKWKESNQNDMIAGPVPAWRCLRRIFA